MCIRDRLSTQSTWGLFINIQKQISYNLPFMKTQSQLFLGFDLSTQGLKALIFDYTNFSIIAHEKLIFEKDLPQYKTDNGVYIGYQGEVTSNSYMFVEAIDTILQKFKSQKINFSQILAVSFSAEQHGSIYWRNGAQQEILSNLDPSKSLCEQLKEANAFSKPYCPIWMDSSTTKYCKNSRNLCWWPFKFISNNRVSSF
eukprot:TRINITY_DN1952_c0_g1_i2.p2 TRINITY_DN1952_c0_g1~~TRINITY_DN1952_c0_g1_i2.p2  ORF type:complete len:199 (-),score=28.55 TRINITY_DN1952_c0_g1_i2:366-962(-)